MALDLRQQRFAFTATVLTWSYPAVLIFSFYLTWLIAWSFLGHSPRPSLDDPKFISDWLSVPYNLTALLLVGFPAAALAGVGSTAWFGAVREMSWLKTLMLVLAFLGVWVGAIAFLRWDPQQVVMWFFD
jgi:hypothetical protein